jgi:hypothetical protein
MRVVAVPREPCGKRVSAPQHQRLRKAWPRSRGPSLDLDVFSLSLDDPGLVRAVVIYADIEQFRPDFEREATRRRDPAS